MRGRLTILVVLLFCYFQIACCRSDTPFDEYDDEADLDG